MHHQLLLFLILIVNANCAIPKPTSPSVSDTVKIEVSKVKQTTQFQSKVKGLMKGTSGHKNKPKDKGNKPQPTKPTGQENFITTEIINNWAQDISKTLTDTEKCVVRREALLKGFSNVKPAVRNGTAIVEEAAKALEELLESRGRAAEKIMRKAEALAKKKMVPPVGYQFLDSIELDALKKIEIQADEYELPLDCRSPYKIRLENNSHFNADVNLDLTSVHMAAEVFYCDYRVLPDLYWSENLLDTFRENYAQDAMTDFQYFCSAKGFLRHYPAASWESLFNLHLDLAESDVYDCRLRPWYVSASGAPRDVLLLLDASGSMSNSSKLSIVATHSPMMQKELDGLQKVSNTDSFILNPYSDSFRLVKQLSMYILKAKVIAEKFILAMLSALTDDDQVNVLRYNVKVESPVHCFNDRLVPANHENTAALMAAMEDYKTKNESYIAMTLEYAVSLLRKQYDDPERPSSCQQAIVLITDSLYENFTDHMRKLDPKGTIRVFVLWLHDPFGLRDNTRELGTSLGCAADGHFAELSTHADVTEHVLRVLRVLERPLVKQRRERLRVYSDVYAHVEDPRRGEYYWVQKENEEQAFRYHQLRKDKERLLNGTFPVQNYQRFKSITDYGQYYEGETVNYRLQISVGVPVFDFVTSENITIKLDEQKQRNSTRTYPVNRLLGVAGIDIPIDHLKLYLPYHKLGAGGTFMLVDHRGNVVIHENMKPVFDGDILKPGYRTVDFLDIEQPAEEHTPRDYPAKWLEFRKALIINKESGNQTMHAKQIFEDGMRAILENREYYWKRILDHYTLIAVLPTYNKKYPAATGTFSQELAEQALAALIRTDFIINPDWLYCRHVDPAFDTRFHEFLYFIRRRRDDPNFPMKSLNYSYKNYAPNIVERTYMCDEELMVRACRDAVATRQWAEEGEEANTERDCSQGELGATASFLATESGLTRWQTYHTTGQLQPPPDGALWELGPLEPWYRRAVAAPDALVVHAPVAPRTYLRNTDRDVPEVGTRAQWFTVARTLGHPNQGFIGVAGFHFYPEHLEKVLKSITYHMVPCEDEDKPSTCDPRCDGIVWTCIIVDDAGWIVARTRDEDEPSVSSKEAPREHLANYHPAAMSALLRAQVFKLHWIHDYQAVCFPEKSAAVFMPSLLRSLWRSANLLVLVAREIITMITFLNYSSLVLADTEKEKRKRRRKLFRDYEREKYDALYDDRVLVNRTTFAACDRSRAIYELQRDEKALQALSQNVKLCSWPLKAAIVPKTNLVLMAVYRNCTHKGRPVPNPHYNIQVPLDLEQPPGSDERTEASLLACARNNHPPPDRVIHTTCFPHQYHQEEGYRQCGPWLPDPEPEN